MVQPPYLRCMQRVNEVFSNVNLSPLERIFKMWYVSFLVRGWRNWAKNTYGNMENSLTTNTYVGLELNAHALVILMVNYRNNHTPEQFLILNYMSQPAEELFRELRSMTTTEHTQADFTLKDFGEKVR